MNVSFDFNFWTVLLFLANFALAFFVSWSGRSKAARDELSDLRQDLAEDIDKGYHILSLRVDKHSERLARVETGLQNSITQADVTAIHRRVDEVLSNSKIMEGQLSMITANLKDIHNIMLTGGPRGH